MIKGWPAWLCVVAAFAAGAGCANDGPGQGRMKGAATMLDAIDRKCDFSGDMEPLESNECTPPAPASLEGILINVPEEVHFEGSGTLKQTGTVLRLCGRCKFPHDFMDLGGSFYASIVFVAVDKTTHQTYSGRFEPVMNLEPPPEPVGSLPGISIGEFFNPDLADILRLPACEATYVVYATLGTFKSNVLEVRVVRSGARP